MTGQPTSAAVRRRVLRDPLLFAAFGFGTGLVPRAPGTAGSLPGLLVGWLALSLAMPWKLAILAALVVAGVPLCGVAARRIGVHDHPGIVWDEITGMYAVLLVAPPQIGAWAASFLAFRLFDIWKPWPIRDLDHRLSGGAGIMLDDLIAALYAASLLAFAGWLIG